MTQQGSREVVVLLGTSFDRLQHQGTRWRFLLREWAHDPAVTRLVAVDFPKFAPRRALSSRLAGWRPSWLEGCELLVAQVPLHARSARGGGIAWRRAGGAVQAALGPATAPRLAVAATPLSVPMLDHLGADRTAFDAVDDWRALPGVQHLRSHVLRGYRSLKAVDRCTAVSDGLGRTLHDDFGVTATTVPNGVDLDAYAAVGPAPDGLPDVPFAVYVGVVQQRVDLSLVERLVQVGVPVVVAGPAEGEAARRLRASGAQWLGRIEVDLVPGLLQRAAVGLVPHVVDPLTRSMDPMKVLEYLAAGLPVVTTPVARSLTTDRVVEAEGDAFVEEVRRALGRPRPEGPDPALSTRDWAAVAQRLMQVLTH